MSFSMNLSFASERFPNYVIDKMWIYLRQFVQSPKADGYQIPPNGLDLTIKTIHSYWPMSCHHHSLLTLLKLFFFFLLCTSLSKLSSLEMSLKRRGDTYRNLPQFALPNCPMCPPRAETFLLRNAASISSAPAAFLFCFWIPIIWSAL